MPSEPICDIVSRVVQNIQSKKQNSDFFYFWEKAVGKRISKHTKPIYLQKRKLIVNVDKAGWLYELNIFKPFLLRRLKKTIPSQGIEDLKFQIGKV
ncbi:MAG: DUF721 domain-containing protein [Candidatus Omnitrophica bacterium]|nr:DUF721 domain-containing protein [Candidatus Omnitrophota bacterium]